MRRPVFSSPAKTRSGDNFHLQALGPRAFVYQSTPELVQKLLAFNRSRATAKPWAQRAHWDAYSSFAPRHVMLAFACVFLRNGTCRHAHAPVVGQHSSDRISLTMRDDVSDPCAVCSTYTYFPPWSAPVSQHS